MPQIVSDAESTQLPYLILRSGDTIEDCIRLCEKIGAILCSGDTNFYNLARPGTRYPLLYTIEDMQKLFPIKPEPSLQELAAMQREKK